MSYGKPHWVREPFHDAIQRIALILRFSRHYETQPEQYPKTGEGFTSGLGVGLLSATAAACSRTLVDLPRVAAQLIPIAFRYGAVVDKILQQFHQAGDSGGSSSLYVPNPNEAIVQGELDTFYEYLVSSKSLPLYRKHVLNNYRMSQNPIERLLD